MMASRRRFLTIAGAAAVAGPLAGLSTTPANSTVPLRTWTGRALGAETRITLAAPNAAAVMAGVRAELERLDAIFSLFRSDSALVELNQSGSLVRPPYELTALLDLCDIVHRRTHGAFDPTIQTLWRVYGEQAEYGMTPSREEIDVATKMVGWHLVSYSAAKITLRDGAQITLNGIAQGYVADRIAALLRSEGMTGVLVDTGETHAVGGHPSGGPWQVGISDPVRPEHVHQRVQLRDSALAVSAPLGTTIGEHSEVGHIIDPRTGLPADRWRQVAVTARSAALADGLSTAFAVMDRGEIAAAAGEVDVILQ